MAGTKSEYRRLLDTELVALARQGDAAAQSVLYERYEASVRNFVRPYLKGNPGYVEDVCLLTFEKFFKNIASFDLRKELKPWLLTISRNTALDHLDSVRKEEDKREKAKDAATAEAADVTSGFDLEREFILQQDYARLMALMEGLDPKYGVVIRKRILEDKEYEEIARELELPLNTVKTRIRRARAMLIEMMKNEEG